MKLTDILKSQNMLIRRYLMGNIAYLFMAIFIVMALVIFGNQLFLVVKESIKSNIFIADLLPLVGLKVMRDVHLILSLSLFLGIILSLNHLYKNSEAIVMNSLGLGDKNFITLIQPLVILMAIIVLFLSTYLSPWAQQQRYLIMQDNANASEFLFIKEAEFQKFKQGEMIFYSAKISNTVADEQILADVFVYTNAADGAEIVLAKKAQKYTDDESGNIYLRLKDGMRYHGFPGKQNKKILNFDFYDLQIIDASEQKTIDYQPKVEQKNTSDLWGSKELKDIAELQMRFSQPISIIILSALGILLGKSIRGGKNLGVLLGVAVFIIYHNALLIAKSSLEQGNLSPFIGLGWVHLSLLIFIFIFYAGRHGIFTQYIDKIRVSFFSKG